MNPTGALIGLTIAAGVLMIITGFQQTEPRPVAPKPKRTIRPDIDRRILVTGIVCALVITAATDWWAAGIVLVGASVLVPLMLNERHGQVTDRERLSALASWVESVRDLLAAASGIEEAIVRSADTLPPESLIRVPVWQLKATTEALGLREGLRRFGEELADPIGDYIAASLLVASERPSGAVHGQLSEAASNGRASVALREQVEASRARMWTTASTIVVISVVMVGFVIGTQQTYAAWYATGTGQTVFLICGIIELAAMWSMARMARPKPGHRVVLFDPPTTVTAAT
jgi:tight adherence protein B